MASAFSKQFSGSVSDIFIMHSRTDLRRERLQKRSAEEDNEDERLLSDVCPSHWPVLIDKGHRSPNEAPQAISSKKKPHRGIIFRDDDVKIRIFHQTEYYLKIFSGICVNFCLFGPPNLYGLKQYTIQYSRWKFVSPISILAHISRAMQKHSLQSIQALN